MTPQKKLLINLDSIITEVTASMIYAHSNHLRVVRETGSAIVAKMDHAKARLVLLLAVN